MKLSFVAFAVSFGCAPLSHAEPVHAVRPLEGYVCMNLNLSDAQLRDPSAARVPILTAPRSDSSVGTLATSIVFAKAPEHVVDGYAEVLQLNGKPGWIRADMILPYHSASDPYARCTPSLLSNGRIGTG